VEQPSGSQVDRAALLGAALAAVVALTFGGQGPWDWLASIAGLALLAVLAAYFHLPGPGEAPHRRQLVALSGVAALAATLVVAAPLQLFLSAATPIGDRCGASGAVAAAALRAQEHGGLAGPVLDGAAAEAGATAEGECLGAATNRWLWVPAAGFAVTIFVVGLRRSTGPPAEDDV
jgi:hypothetical protein